MPARWLKPQSTGWLTRASFLTTTTPTSSDPTTDATPTQDAPASGPSDSTSRRCHDLPANRRRHRLRRALRRDQARGLGRALVLPPPRPRHVPVRRHAPRRPDELVRTQPPYRVLRVRRY